MIAIKSNSNNTKQLLTCSVFPSATALQMNNWYCYMSIFLDLFETGFNINTCMLFLHDSFHVKRECCDYSFNCIYFGTPCSHPVCYFLLCYRFWCLNMWMDISGTTLKSLNQMYEQSVPIGSAIADVANQVPHNQHTVYLPLGYQFIICVILFRTPCYNPIQVH